MRGFWSLFSKHRPNTATMPPPGVCLDILEVWNKQNGIGSLSNPERFLNQDYQKLTEYCLTNRFRYTDEMFPPDKNSIGYEILSPSQLEKVKWLRPAVSILGGLIRIRAPLSLCSFCILVL